MRSICFRSVQAALDQVLPCYICVVAARHEPTNLAAQITGVYSFQNVKWTMSFVSYLWSKTDRFYQILSVILIE